MARRRAPPACLQTVNNNTAGAVPTDGKGIAQLTCVATDKAMKLDRLYQLVAVPAAPTAPMASLIAHSRPFSIT